jgi:quercetin dioxygenase-like cupin family protein
MIVDWQGLGGSGPTRFLFEGEPHGAALSFFETDFPPGRGPRLHRHPYAEVFVVHEGRARFTAGEETFEAEPGQVVVVPEHAPHRFVNATDGRLRVTSIHPSPRVIQEDLE